MIKNRINGVILFCVIFLIFSGTLMGEELKELGLSQAINLAIENNLSLKIAHLNLENSQIDYEKTKADNLLTKSRYIELQGDLSLLQAKDSYTSVRNQLIIDVVQKYLQLIQSKKNVSVKEKELELEKKLLEEVTIQVQAGHKGSLELLQQENKYNNAIFNLEEANNDYQQSFTEFKFELGLNNQGGEQFYLIEMDYPNIWEIDEEEALKRAIDNSFSLESRRRQIELTEVDLEKAEVAASPELDLKKLRNNQELADLNYEKTLKELSNSIKKQYYAYKQSINSLNLSQQNLNQAKENNGIIIEQVKAGLKTKNDLLSSEISLLQAENNLKSAILNYYLAKLALQQLMGQNIEEGDIK